MLDVLNDFSRLCVHTQTTKPWDLKTCIDAYAASGIQGISIWRHLLEGQNLDELRQYLAIRNIKVASLVRGGFFPSVVSSIRKAALEDNRQAIKEAAALGASLVVLVCGADPKQSLERSRQQILDGIAVLIPEAKAAGVKLAIEPLHPMYAADKSAVTTLAEANDIAEALDSAWVGIAIDVYHLWWDQDLKQQINRCGENGNLLAFHVCDWKVPTLDMLTDRGLMGEGCINIKQIRTWVEATGFNGFIEVEVFSNRHWNSDQYQYLDKIKKAYIQNT